MEWMHDSYELLADRRIDQLLLPGTHDSAAHTLAADQPRLGPSAADRFLAWLARAFPSAVAPWTLTQHAPVYDQLRAGVRFLDLRVAWSPPVPGGTRPTGAGDGVFWCAHTFACQPLKAVLQDVSDFLAATSHEVLVLALRPDWPHRQPFTQHPHLGPRLAADVAAALRGQLYPPPPPVAPRQSVAAPQRKAAPAGGTGARGGGELGGAGSGADGMAVAADVDVPVSAEAAAAAAAVAAAGGLQLPSLRAMVESGRRVLVFFDPPRVPASDVGMSVPAGRPRPHPQPPPPSARVTPPPAVQPAVSVCPVGARVSDAGCCFGCGPPALRAGLRLHTCFQGGGNDRNAAASSCVSAAIAAGAGAAADSAEAIPRVRTARTSCAAAAASLHPPPSYRRPIPTTTTSTSNGDRCSSDAGADAEGDAGGDCDCDTAAAVVVKPPCSRAPHLSHGDGNGLEGDLPADRLWLGSLCRPLWADSSSPRGTVTGLLQLLADARRRPLGPGPCWHAAAAATPTPLSVVRDVLRYGVAAAGLRRLAAELEADELPRLLAAAAPVSSYGPAAAHAAEHASAAVAAAAASGLSATELMRTPVSLTAAGQVAGRGVGATQGAGAVAAGGGDCGSSCAAAGVGVGDGDGGGGGGGGGGDLQLWDAAQNGGGLDVPGGAGAGPGGLLRWGRVFAVCLDHPSPEALEAVWRLNLLPSPPSF